MIDIDARIKDTMKRLMMVKKNHNLPEYEQLIHNAQSQLDALKMVKTRIMELKTAKNAKQYDEQTEVNMLRKMVKEREDTAKIYFENNRPELAEAEIMQSVFIKELLPEDVSEDTINEYIDKEFPVITQKEMGFRIKCVKEKFPTADGAVIAKLIKARIQ